MMNSDRETSFAVKSGAFDGVKVPVLTYHSIDDSGSVISTPPAVFQRQIKYLSDAGYSSLTLRDMVSSLTEGQRLPDKPVVLTFDDGFQNFLYRCVSSSKGTRV